MNEAQTWMQLRDALRNRFARDGACARRGEASDTARMIDRLGEPRSITPRSQPVVDDHLRHAIANSRTTDPLLAQALEAVAPLLRWNLAYPDDPDPRLSAMARGYAYTVIAGPDSPHEKLQTDAPFLTDEFACGLTIQAPAVDYPSHAHRAVEVYGVVSGTAEWQHGPGPREVRPPGSLMVHGPFDDHAMVTDDEPLLTFFSWVSDLDSEPVLT